MLRQCVLAADRVRPARLDDDVLELLDRGAFPLVEAG